MPILSELDIVKTFHLEKYGPIGKTMAKQVMVWLKLDKMNTLYDEFSHLQGIAFIDSILDKLGVHVQISDSDLKRIPKSGPFIFVSNHPLGGIDGMILLKMLLQIDPNSKLMANFLLQKIAPISAYICPVNPFEERKDAYSSIAGIRSSLAHLKAGYPIGIFPAGEVSSRENGFLGKICDKHWDESAIKLIRKANVPVIPIYFHAKNSDLFYVLAGINANFRTASLPSEMLTKKHKNIVVRVGKHIDPKQIAACTDIKQCTSFLRHRTYRLGSPYLKSKIIDFNQFKRKIKPVPIQIQFVPNKIVHEIEYLKMNDCLLLVSNQYQVFFTKFDHIPAIKSEICRLREITFRDIGEGTGKAYDTDRYDLYYHQLILWDDEHQVLVGAYRMGLGHEIMSNYGMNGFYMNDFFSFSEKTTNIFAQSIEIGRAFVRKEYQQKPFPLFVLWKGIVKVTEKYPEYTYLIGAASISSAISPFSRSIIVEFLSIHHFDTNLAKYVTPKSPYKSILKPEDKLWLNLESNSCIKTIDKLIEEIEPEGLKIPILIKKYLLQNAKLLAFNVDSHFNDAIDGLMYIRVADIHIEGIS